MDLQYFSDTFNEFANHLIPETKLETVIPMGLPCIFENIHDGIKVDDSLKSVPTLNASKGLKCGLIFGPCPTEVRFNWY